MGNYLSRCVQFIFGRAQRATVKTEGNRFSPPPTSPPPTSPSTPHTGATTTDEDEIQSQLQSPAPAQIQEISGTNPSLRIEENVEGVLEVFEGLKSEISQPRPSQEEAVEPMLGVGEPEASFLVEAFLVRPLLGEPLFEEPVEDEQFKEESDALLAEIENCQLYLDPLSTPLNISIGQNTEVDSDGALNLEQLLEQGNFRNPSTSSNCAKTKTLKNVSGRRKRKGNKGKGEVAATVGENEDGCRRSSKRIKRSIQKMAVVMIPPDVKMETVEKGNESETTEEPEGEERDDEENLRAVSSPERGSRQKVVMPQCIQTLSAGGKPLYHCTVCLAIFKTKYNVLYHDFHADEKKKPFVCDICQKGFITKSHFIYHSRVHSGEKPFVCPICPEEKRFHIQSKLNRHMRIHEGTKKFSCDLCPKMFLNKQSLQLHHRTHTGERPYSCSECEKSFASAASLKRHKTNVHAEERPFICNCGKAFADKDSLKRHEKVHTDEKKFKCDSCGRAFKTSKDLRRHSAIHSEIRPFQCEICKHSFRRGDNFLRHCRTVHRIHP